MDQQTQLLLDAAASLIAAKDNQMETAAEWNALRTAVSAFDIDERNRREPDELVECDVCGEEYTPEEDDLWPDICHGCAARVKSIMDGNQCDRAKAIEIIRVNDR